jgi:ribosomal protein S6E (S10)
MADLISPGVQISVQDDSFYASAGAGTVPLLVIATAQDKISSDSSGIAAYTTSANAGKVHTISSQRELLINYGNPTFFNSNGTPLNGHELNEYGLEAARSFLSFSNRAHVLRADVDLAKLQASPTAPTLAPADGTYWLDTSATVWGVKRWVNTSWVRQTVTVPTSNEIDAGGLPKKSYGLDFDIAVVYFDNLGNTASVIKLCEKRSGNWFLLGESEWGQATDNTLQINDHLNIPSARTDGSAHENNDIFIQTTAPNQGTTISTKLYDANTAQWLEAPVFGSRFSSAAHSHYDNSPTEGDLWADYDQEPLGSVVLRRWDSATQSFSFTAAVVADPVNTFNIAPHLASNTTPAMYITVNDSGATSNTSIGVYFDSATDGNASITDAASDIAAAISGATDVDGYPYEVRVTVNENNQIVFEQEQGYNLKFFNGGIAGWNPGVIGIGLFGTSSAGVISTNSTPGYDAWADLSYEASAVATASAPVDGTLWYDNVVSRTNLDLLVNTGTSWTTFLGDVSVQVLAPSTRSDGISPLSSGDIWVSTADLEKYPLIYRYTGSSWSLLDNTDQDSDAGVLFGDFRADSTSSLYSDAPQGTLYPTNILAWNMAGSGGVVKEWDGDGSRWLTASGLKPDGSPYMLRKAQRRMVVRGIQAAITTNTDILNETLDYNLIACPGYPELADEMNTLNTNRKETAFILVDTPMRLKSDITTLTNWMTNADNAAETGEDGLLTKSPYMGVYYPSGRATSIDGTNIVVPASHMTLRTLAYNDQVAYPWFAPAGYQRGIVNNATSVGYVDGESSEFVPVNLNEGQRDAMYLNQLNPIANFNGRGLVVFGQKTLNPNASALDRVNVARLVVYIRRILDDAVRPFLFEPNDELTRQNAKSVVDRFLGQLITTRALGDFITVCDTSNNTPDRIDRNELYIDIAIQPIKSVEFIYVPIRIQNTLGSTQGNTLGSTQS